MNIVKRLSKFIFSLCPAIVLGLILITTPQAADAKGCGPSGADLKQGPRGGCFYINRNGNKTYVDRACCR
ncbi:hypothetical protein V8Z77_12310 [Stutzerimonas stutzeri]|uniref:hypothetical protein n=1 Tax=Stutzerimonas stutzeri TaxID=316 RepID=UPI000C998905|nr:hypothetical protein [Stutzerimonas stutzeri]PNG15597.1 hypothetical protein CXK97_05315 [Stutzerimonas stutzeri]